MANGMSYTYNDTVTLQRTISGLLKIINPNEIPLQKLLGMNKEKSVQMQMWGNNKYAWLQDTQRVRASQLAEALDDNETGVDVDDGTLFKPGDVILCELEKMWVASVSTNTLTVLRGWGGTAGATHADDSPIKYLFSARTEGQSNSDSPYTVPTEIYNYTQIFHGSVDVSGSEMEAARYGITDQRKYRIMKLIGGLGSGDGKMGDAGDLLIDLENTFYYGEPIARSSGVASGMGGVESFVTTNVTDLNSDPLDPDTLNDAIASAWGYGRPDLIICNSHGKKKINSFFKDTVRTERSDETGGVLINKIDTDFGTLSVLMTKQCPTDRMYIVQKNLLGWATLRSWKEEQLAKTGDSSQTQIVGEYGFIVENERAHAIIKEMSTTA
jgi:hypothetical protein